MPDCGVHYLWFAFVSILIRSHTPSHLPAYMTWCLVEVLVQTANDVPNLAETELAGQVETVFGDRIRVGSWSEGVK